MGTSGRNAMVDQSLLANPYLSKTMAELEKFALSQPETDHIVSILGFSFMGQGQNVGLALTGGNVDAPMFANTLAMH